MSTTYSPDLEYLTMEQAASKLQMCERTLRRLRLRNEVIQPVRLGGRLYYTREQMEAIKRKLHIQAGFSG